MFGLILKNKILLHFQMLRNFASKTESGIKLKKNWDLHVGVLIERLPITSKSLNNIEQEFQNLLLQQEFEGSLKSDHELKNESDQIQIDKIRKGELEIDLDENASKQTAQDLKDAYSEEYKKFKFANREIESDEQNDIQSPERILEETLYLIIKEKMGCKNLYSVPQGERKEGETLRDTAERVVKENCGQNIGVLIYGNSPFALYKYKYPASLQNYAIGVKVFLYRACLINRNFNRKISDKYEWQTKTEISQKLQKEKSFMENLPKLLF